MIHVTNLSKVYKIYRKQGVFLKDLFQRQYEDKIAVNDISFSIEQGEIVGFLGPNGAGKTTTLKMLSGLLYPSNGTVAILGYTPWERKREFLKQISLIMGQRQQLIWDLTPMDSFLLRKTIYQIPDDVFKEFTDEIIEMLSIHDIIDIQTKRLSLGQKMKCEIALSLLHKPSIVFLDEPTLGLDIVIQQKLRSFLREYNKKYHATILLTSHYMDDVASICERIIVIKQGSKVYDGSLKTFISEKGKRKMMEVVIADTIEASTLLQYGEVISFENNVARIFIDRENVSDIVARILRDMHISDIRVEEPDLEDLIKEIF